MTHDQAMAVLATVSDPEIPVLSIVDLGIVERLACAPDLIEVWLIPTFAGCPALELIRRSVSAALQEAGAPQVQVTFLTAPAWTTDRITPRGLTALASFGIAAPGEQAPACPYCQSTQTRRESTFGPTLCRQVFYCDACQQPFERMKLMTLAPRPR
ncbi:MAG: 1,2-phenylacetyl-CoA epoxidase subunit PaaD [Sulfobacillus sp.]